MKNLLTLLAINALLLMPASSLAYLDPGSSGLLVQLLFGGVAGFLVVLKIYWFQFVHYVKALMPGYWMNKQQSNLLDDAKDELKDDTKE